jgi:hypothetical protein
MMKMKEKSELGSVAAILERELGPTIKEWLRRVNLLSQLTDIPLSDKDRTRHLPVMFRELIFRLRLPNDAHRPVYVTAGAHGQRRQAQGYSPSMLVEESRIFEVATFRTLHLHHSELDQRRLLSDVMVIADEADAQLREAVRGLTAKGMPTPQHPRRWTVKMPGLSASVVSAAR